MGTSIEDTEPVRGSDGVAGRRRRISIIAAGSVGLAVGTLVLSVRAAHRQNHVALAGSPRLVTVAPATATNFRDTRLYVGAVEPWVEANVGPQYVSAYVETVTVRPGAAVRRGEVLATLDCANPSAESRAVAMRARAVDAEMRATADEAQRLSTMLDGGFVSPNEVEQKMAASHARRAELLETNARLLRASLDVQDCILRAPFDGEIGTRAVDPGAFVHPGAAIVSVVDRRTVRVTADAPEKDFDALSPRTSVKIRMLAIDAALTAPIARRAPRAAPTSRTIHFEVDVPNPDLAYPVGTTATVQIDVGEPKAATAIPLYATTQQEGKAKLFVVEGDVAKSRTVPVLGETGGSVFFEPSVLPERTLVVTEGRTLLSDGDRVRYKLDESEPRGPATGGGEGPRNPGRGGGYGRPL
ncbi:MAG TPA: efflux RND transporter periplasmic adaptor subunit [Polyangiaceae bacterium]|nr:efflux RND transporter periplasmic adaptor subunit [Polyangiaceae bacterium]